MKEILRTPDSFFDQLPDFNYKPCYTSDLPGYQGIRIGYIDEGNKDSEVFLCLHGQPTWSYLYRKMITPFLAAGYRVLIPDLIGFGRSDKPVDDRVYTFSLHREMLIGFIKKLNLSNITLVCQDWGGVLGLTLPLEFPRAIKKLIIMNTCLATGDEPLSKGFLSWRKWASEQPDMDIAALMKRACPHLSPKECKAYSAPFPNASFKSGVRRFPELFPEFENSPGAELSRSARRFFSEEWEGDSFMAIGMGDPVLGPEVMNRLRRLIPNCSPPLELDFAGHFVQEWGLTVAENALIHFESR